MMSREAPKKENSMSLRNCIHILPIGLSLVGSLAMGQSGQYEVQKVVPDQPGEYRVVTRGDAPAQEIQPPVAGDPRFWVTRAPSSALSIGVYASPVPPVMASQLRLGKGRGLVVEQVMPGSAAERAGIQRYDVIERINNRQVTSPQQVEQMMRGNKAGDRVAFLIIRQGERQNTEVAIDSGLPGQPGQTTTEKPYSFSPKDYLPNRFQFSPDQTRELQQMSDQLKKEVEQQERQIERLKENLRREADQARRELEKLKDQIRNELEQQKRQMLDQLKNKSDSDKADSDKRDESRPEVK
jgi:membrane-associated protease RseP (regulator of RpoE activity)